MENCKISEAEAERVLVKRVNNRPNAMATYGMAKMGPTDTKDIFDKQFALVKEKHNLLVDKTADIYQEQERMSEQVSDHSEKLNDLEDKIDKIQVPDSNIPDWAKQPEKPSYSKEEVGLANVDNVRQYSENNPPPYPVTSVNGQAGDVRLGAGDVGAMPADTKIPAKTSDITNDSGFITKVVSDLANYYTKSQTFTRDEINAKISAIPKFAIEVVSSLPTSNISETTVYLVGGGSGNDLYTEYIYANGKWEILGAQTVDLTGYATETWVITQLGAYLKQSELEAAIESALASIPDWAKSSEKPSYNKSEVGLGNVDNVKQYSESNPPPYPVTSVNGQAGDVSLGASDVGALPASTKIPAKTSDITNDSGFIKSNEAPVQSVNGKAGVVTLAAGDVGARPSTWTPTYSDVGADKSGTASSAVSSHNTNTDAHNDIRLLIAGLTEKLNALANSTDDDLDQMAEIVAYIKSNKTLIDSITTSKVSVADVVNNLTSNVANKPLSAAQGVVLKALIDAITVPTKVSQLTNDKGYLTSYTETDPTVPSWAKQSSKPRYNANEVGAVAYTAQSLTEEQKAQARANIAALGKMDVSLGIASDGLIYLFVNGEPVGTGIPQGQSGDVFGYVDENNTIVLTGAIPDGTYSIKYEMEDGSTVDIGDLVLDTNVYYSVTRNLTNCSISNSATQVIEGESYSATITANDGYELKSVTVTMGDAAVTVTNGVINIASVTGNIVITAVAEEVAVTPNYTNLLPSAIDADGTPYNGGLGYIEGYRLSGSSTTGVSALANCCASGYMPISSSNDEIRIKNITVCSENTANRLTFYDSSKTKLYEVGSFHSNLGVTVNDGVYSAKPKYWENTASVAYFRFSVGVISENTIVTVNEEIV